MRCSSLLKQTGRAGRFGLAVAVAMAIAGCSTPFSPPQFTARDGGSTGFPGIIQLVSTSPERTLDVLFVHGMCTHDAEWAGGVINHLDTALGGSGKVEPTPRPVPGTQVTLYQAELALPAAPERQGTVRATALMWSPIVAPLKKQLCFDQTKRSANCDTSTPYPYQRAAFNAKFKDGLLDDCLADVLIYQGLSRKAISEQIQQAIVAAASDTMVTGQAAARAAAATRRRLVIVAESLGSKITFDAIHALINNPQKSSAMRAAGVQTLARTVQIFMAANQLPMLALADQDIEASPKPRGGAYTFPKDPLKALLELVQAKKGARAESDPPPPPPPPPKIIAFTDPNDLLSWILVPSTQAGGYEVVDVLVSNTSTIFGLIESPDSAHRGYLGNREVIELITHGHRDSKP